MNSQLQAQLFARLNKSEDPWVERKHKHHDRETRKTVVAFANSIPENETAVLFIGASNDGNHPGVLNADETQKEIQRTINQSYPPIKYQTYVLSISSNPKLELIAVLVPFSEKRPHFAGSAFVRIGSQTFEANEEIYKELIDSSQDKVRALLKFKDKSITARFLSASNLWFDDQMQLLSCDAFSVKLKDSLSYAASFPLSDVEILSRDQFPTVRIKSSWDNESQIRKMVGKWNNFAKPDAAFDPTHHLVHQFLANPEAVFPTIASLLQSNPHPRLQMLFVQLNFEIKKRKTPMTRDQKLFELKRAFERGIEKGSIHTYKAQVGAVCEIATSIEEVDEFLRFLTYKNDMEMQINQRKTAYMMLGVPKEFSKF